MRFMQPESSLPHIQVALICPYLEPDHSTPCSPFKLPEDTSSHLLLGLPSHYIDIYLSKTITTLTMLLLNVSRTVMMLCSMIGGYQLYSCLSVCRTYVCFTSEDGSSVFLQNTDTKNTLAYTKLS